MVTEALTIKGNKSGIKILINATFTFNEILQDLEKKFIQNTKFFEGAAIKLESNTLEVLSEEQFSTISNVMTKNIQIACVNDYEEYLSSNPKIKLIEEEPKTEMSTEFLMGNIRSGQHIKSEGHVVIMGDINSGAQVESKGNICVMGVIRGTVHAGIDGNTQAFISCKQFDAPQAQIRIADLIVRAKQEANMKTTAGLEIAHIENDTIIVLSKE